LGFFHLGAGGRCGVKKGLLSFVLNVAIAVWLSTPPLLEGGLQGGLCSAQPPLVWPMRLFIGHDRLHYARDRLTIPTLSPSRDSVASTTSLSVGIHDSEIFKASEGGTSILNRHHSIIVNTRDLSLPSLSTHDSRAQTLYIYQCIPRLHPQPQAKKVKQGTFSCPSATGLS